MATITWLHLSDLHFKYGPDFENFNRNTVLKALWKDIGNQIAKGLEPDFVMFSGDIAYQGKKNDYELAREHFFEPLLNVTGLTKDRLFVVPGNHDLDWDVIDPIIATGMRVLLTDRDQINQFLSPGRDRSHTFRKFHAYAEFINTYFEDALTFDDTGYFYARIIEVQGHKLAVIGLNSAWMSACMKDGEGRAMDQGNLLIGERQLDEALNRIEQADLRIALVHHPVDWLHDIDRFEIENRLNAECDFILHGHWHMPQTSVHHSMAGQAVYIPAGAVYAHRDYANSYNFVQVDFRSREVKVHLRRYNDRGPRGPEWTKDVQATGEERDGVFELQFLPERLVETPIIPPPPVTAKRILLVEDEPKWQKAIQSILVTPNFDLEIATSYAEARIKLQASFDLIIINLCLVHDNDYEGVALLDDLAEEHAPCIVLTGSATTMRGLFERYNVCEAFVKGRAFNKARFLRTVKEVTKKAPAVGP